MIGRSIRTAALGLLIAAAAAGQALGQSSDPQCPVEAAADAALQRQISLLDAVKVDPAEFFNGARSCIDQSLLRNFDLSMAIPDPMGLLQSIAQSIGNNVLDAAKQKACDVLNEQLGDAVGQMRQVLNTVRSPDDAVQAALDRVTNRAGLDRISLAGLGQYGGGGGANSFGAPLILPPPSPQPKSTQSSATVRPSTVTSGSSLPPALQPGTDEYQQRLRCAYLGDC